MHSVEQALSHLLAQAQPQTETETRSLVAALGCILAETIVSPVNVPPHDNAMMDGYAVYVDEASNSTSDSERDFTQQAWSISQRIPAGTDPQPLAPNTVARIFTGAPIPAGANAVVMQEAAEVIDTEQDDLPQVRFTQAVQPGQFIRQTGEDIAQGDVILTAGTRLTPQALALAASVGRAQVAVYQPLRVATFTTGDELLAPGTPPQPGKIYNANHTTIVSLLTQHGFEVVDLGQVEDSLVATQVALQQAAEQADVIMTTGGVSVGEEDHIKAAVQSLGELDLWRVQMKPGKPLAYGRVGKTPFIGLPGNPVSAFATFCLFARPYLLKMQGQQTAALQKIWVQADFNWLKPDARREYVRVQLHTSGQGSWLKLFPKQGSGVLTSTVWADGLAIIPENQQIHLGDWVEYLPFNQFN
ncbi:molybdenum cofactor biosynthesis protein MoaA [Thiomicrospira aerophila AL3]|uniref:Molybdopterin molybdenumtransferase n=1 Tax=Thiomicrospira aerophila AL3 TaxID=717772 RepID=W0DSV0_9GAMM|nr:gephyrin-like molybdotransferase Glp [Thiomicrospira aerophila]AHF00348.1 molybdenum cofactor biosynthesis protein MoaA [Thiomicrospira aerophila AL3]